MTNVTIKDHNTLVEGYSMEEVERVRFADAVASKYNEAQDLLLSKHKDYGPKNIANAPGGALNGLTVRMHDKLARIANLLEQGQGAQHESIRDSLVDLANYALIGVLVLDEEWPGA